MLAKRLSLWIAAGSVVLGAAAAATKGAAEPTTIPFSTTPPAAVTNLPSSPLTPTNLDDLKAIQTRVEAVVKANLPATVAILLDDAQGSGVIVSKDGYVLTAGHVSGTPGQLMQIVLANGKIVRAKALGANNGIDSGMVKITSTPPAGGFPFVPLGSSKDLKGGQWVVAMGHPGGLQENRPPVVRLGRVLLANRFMIGTDCPLISGDSGGPLFDLDGRLIGINSRIGATTTTNIHVPIDTFETTWDRLVKGDEWDATSGFLARRSGGGEGPAVGALLGITAMNDTRGALVSRVKTGTPAETAGFKTGDVVLIFGGLPIKGPDDLAADVNKHYPGDWVKVQVLRGDSKVWVTVKLGALH